MTSMDVYAAHFADELAAARRRVEELETTLRAILSLGRTSDPAEDRQAIDGLARSALGGRASVGARLTVVDGKAP